jgi:hypothetical protein
MPEDEPSVNRGWLVEPLGPNDVRIHIDVGDGVELSEEARAALDTLLAELHEGEVAGHAMLPHCPSLKACSHYSCFPLGKCTLETNPCFANTFCTIAP